MMENNFKVGDEIEFKNNAEGLIPTPLKIVKDLGYDWLCLDSNGVQHWVVKNVKGWQLYKNQLEVLHMKDVPPNTVVLNVGGGG